jgi:AcrR family transcriptional regulator
MPNAPTRKRLSGEARRAAIIDAARLLFAERGLDGSTREIASRLGVTQALLYRYFPSKEALVQAVYESVLGTWDASRATVLHDPDRPLAERVGDFYAAYLGRNGDYRGVRLFVWAALAGIDLPLRYSPDLDALVLRPVLTALRAELGLPPAPLPLPRAERDVALGMHGAVVFIGIRRFVYGATMTDERHVELVRGIIRTWLPGALEQVKLSNDN